MNEMKFFALNASRPLGEEVAKRLGMRLAEHEERDFEDGEHKARPLEDVLGKDVFVLHSLYGEPGQSANDKLCRLLFFIGALRNASARRIIPVVPYLCYARKDRKTKARDPITSQYIARLFEAMQVDMFVSLDVHNLPAFHNAFRCPTHHLEARAIFVDELMPLLDGKQATVLSPDSGGVKRAEKFRETLSERLEREADSAFIEKHRSEGVVSGGTLVGKVEDKVVVVVDDLICTGTTMIRAAAACRESGATAVYAVATHGLFTGKASGVLNDDRLDGVWVSDSIPPFRLEKHLLGAKVRVLSCAPLLAKAIERIHAGQTLTDILAI